MANREARWHVIDGVLKLKCRGAFRKKWDRVYSFRPGSAWIVESYLIALEGGGYVWNEYNCEREYRNGRLHEVWCSSFLSIFAEGVDLVTHPGPPLIQELVPHYRTLVEDEDAKKPRDLTLRRKKGHGWTLFVFGEELYRKDGEALYRVGPQTFVRVEGDSVWVVSDPRLELRANVELEEEGS